MSDTNDLIQSLSRVCQASARWMAWAVWADTVGDANDELTYIKANLARIENLLAGDADD